MFIHKRIGVIQSKVMGSTKKSRDEVFRPAYTVNGAKMVRLWVKPFTEAYKTSVRFTLAPPHIEAYPSGLRITTLSLSSAAKGYTRATIGSNPIASTIHIQFSRKSGK